MTCRIVNCKIDSCVVVYGSKVPQLKGFMVLEYTFIVTVVVESK